MKFDPTKDVLDFDGEVIMRADAEGRSIPMTYQFVIEKSLGVSKTQTGDEQYKRYKIGRIIHEASATKLAEVNAEDVTVIKSAVAEAGWSPFVYGRIVDMLESATVA
jgi:hypothetical protein